MIKKMISIFWSSLLHKLNSELLETFVKCFEVLLWRCGNKQRNKRACKLIHSLFNQFFAFV